MGNEDPGLLECEGMMKILVLEDESGKIWRDFAVAVKEPETPQDYSERYFMRQAEITLTSNFLKYWFSGRFPVLHEDFVKEGLSMMKANGWKIKCFDTQDK